MTRFFSALALLLAVSGCSNKGAVKVVVSFAQFEPGCLEVSAADSAGGDPEVVQLESDTLSGGKASIGVAPAPGWSSKLKLRVRSFEKTCEGAAVEEFSEERTLESNTVTEWQVTLTAKDADDDGFAAAAPGVKGTDCDDASAATNPGAAEECGAIDVNCDGRAGCLDPLCVGRACDDGVSGNTLDVCTAGGGCAGRAFSDCAPGSWVTSAPTATNDRGCTTCPGATFSSTTNAMNCSTWTDCVAGQRVSTTPSGTVDRTCVACEVGMYSTVINSTGCAPVGTCAPGSASSGPPTMTSPATCAPCVVGTYCAGGSSSSLPCAIGTWDDDANAASVCVPWTSCPPGSVLSTPGTATANSGCTACSAGTYCAGLLEPVVPCASGTWDQDANSATACVAWLQCAPGFALSTPGTATNNAACAACSVGTYCAGLLAPSVPCAGGTWDDDANSATACVAWTQCAPGFALSTLGTATTNTACAGCAAGNYCAGGITPIAPCASGTWDHDASSATACIAWASCAPGSVIDLAGSPTNDLTCSACAAGNYCAGGSAAIAPCANSWDHDANSATVCVAWSTCSADTYQSTAPTSTSDRACSNYRSCLDRLTRAPTTPSGSYVIDPDGPGALPTITVTCDMTTTPGGWTVISFEDFSTAATGWSDARRDTTSSCFSDWGAMLGGYNLFGSGATSSKTYNFLNITHTQVRVALDYFVIDSWDNERGRVSLDGTYVFDNLFTMGGTNTCGGGFADRGLQAVVGTPAHTANTAILTVTSTLDQAATDESFGVDNVSVMIR